MSFEAIRGRMNATGIGYAGIEGAWWLPAIEPFVLPAEVHDELQRISHAIFALFDAVTDLYPEDSALRDLLSYKVPPHIPRLISKQRVLSARPDFQLMRQRSGRSERPDRYSLAATELEICPSAQGYAHAMQVGYGLQSDLVEAFARLLDGRTLLFAGTHEWSAFVWEQLAFCWALEAHGARGHVWFDAPVETFAERWQPPMFGVAEKTRGWNDDVRARLGPFKDLMLRDLPASGDGLMVFRFGYFDCFSANVLHQLTTLEHTGATFLNPAHFAFDSKAVMAALHLPGVRERIGKAHLDALDRAIPETRVLTEALLPQLMTDKDEWVLKFAGFDRGQQAWGGRSLQVGAQMPPAEWQAVLRRYCDLPFPVVAQRAMPTATVEIGYFDEHKAVHSLLGLSRLRSFFDRDGNAVAVCGTHLTVSSRMGGMSESTDAVQAPVAFI